MSLIYIHLLIYLLVKRIITLLCKVPTDRILKTKYVPYRNSEKTSKGTFLLLTIQITEEKKIVFTQETAK